jgi:hypothetical protein
MNASALLPTQAVLDTLKFLVVACAQALLECANETMRNVLPDRCRDQYRLLANHTGLRPQLQL